MTGGLVQHDQKTHPGPYVAAQSAALVVGAVGFGAQSFRYSAQDVPSDDHPTRLHPAGGPGHGGRVVVVVVGPVHALLQLASVAYGPPFTVYPLGTVWVQYL